jgi:hypothetical protein
MKAAAYALWKRLRRTPSRPPVIVPTDYRTARPRVALVPPPRTHAPELMVHPLDPLPLLDAEVLPRGLSAVIKVRRRDRW